MIRLSFHLRERFIMKTDRSGYVAAFVRKMNANTIKLLLDLFTTLFHYWRELEIILTDSAVTIINLRNLFSGIYTENAKNLVFITRIYCHR